MGFRLAELFVDITTNDKQALTGIGRVQGAFAGLGSKLLALGGAIGGGMFLYKAVTGASNLNETLSKTGVVFGKSTAEVVAQSEAMSRAFGLSRTEMLDAASVFGLMAKGAGMGQDQAAGFSNQLVKLAADAASFYNVPMGVALEKIRAGLSGEAEPLRAFGVFLSDAAVKAEAARMGIGGLNGELTEGEKILARQSLITKGLADANGDLERTSGSAANQQRKLMGQLQRVQEDIGQVLQPAWVSLLQASTQGLTALSEGFQSNKATIAEWATYVGGAIGGVAGFIKSTLENLVAFDNAFMGLMAKAGFQEVSNEAGRGKITQVDPKAEQAAFQRERARRFQAERDADWARSVIAQRDAMNGVGTGLAGGALAGSVNNSMGIAAAVGGVVGAAFKEAQDVAVEKEKQARTTTLEGFANSLLESGFAKDKALAAQEATADNTAKIAAALAGGIGAGMGSIMATAS
jgi:hypothetical protein